MKSLEEIDSLLQNFENKYGFKVHGAEQGSGTWLQLKLGVLSASNAYKIVAKKDSDTRWTYIYELVAQIASGVAEEINSKYLDYGREHEGAAVTLYELHTKKNTHCVPFIFSDDSYRCGCSPDRVIVGDSQFGLELKVPFTPVQYAKFVCGGHIKPEYQWQCHFSMWITGSETWDYANYSPVFKVKPLHYVTIERDPEKIKLLDDLVPQFIADLDGELDKLGLKFGCQWLRLKSNERK